MPQVMECELQPCLFHRRFPDLTAKPPVVQPATARSRKHQVAALRKIHKRVYHLREQVHHALSAAFGRSGGALAYGDVLRDGELPRFQMDGGHMPSREYKQQKNRTEKRPRPTRWAGPLL